MKNEAVLSDALAFSSPRLWLDVRGIEVKDRILKERRSGIVVYENRDVEFNYYAPQASQVMVDGVTGTFHGPYELKRQPDGWFSCTVKGIEQGFHYCKFYVDGVSVCNPDAPMCGGFENRNVFNVPARKDDFWEVRDVPHGTVHQELYRSGENSRMKTAFIYTPPGYETNSDKTYPVLYLQHGVMENETLWVHNGKANFILDNLIAEKKCEEMIVVMNCGYAFRSEKTEGTEGPFPGDFDAELVYDCIPYVESHYRVKAAREFRAVAGLSLGAMQALQTASKHPGLFGYLGCFSGFHLPSVEQIAAKRYRFDKIFFTAGIHERSEERIGQYLELLRKAGNTDSYMAIYPGRHEWGPWRQSLRDFASMIFHAKELPSYSEKKVDRRPADAFCGRNQALTMHAMYSDPLFWDFTFGGDAKGRPAGQYIPDGDGIEVNGRDVTFRWEIGEPDRVNADRDNAVKVSVVTDGQEYVLEPQGDGIHSVTLHDVKPGFHLADFMINGVRAVHPKAAVGYVGFGGINLYEVEGEEYADYMMKDVPHGALHFHTFRAAVAKSQNEKRQKAMYVYTPAGYEAQTEELPILYLLHGCGESETSWVYLAKIQFLLDNLIAEGRCERMILAMPEGYSYAKVSPEGVGKNFLVEEIKHVIHPMLQGLYRVKSGANNAAVGGISMGGAQAFQAAVKYPELFANAMILSGPYDLDDSVDGIDKSILTDAERFAQTYKYFFMAIGKQDFGYEPIKKNTDILLNEYHLPIEFATPDGFHEWNFWRPQVVHFLEKVFR